MRYGEANPVIVYPQSEKEPASAGFFSRTKQPWSKRE